MIDQFVVRSDPIHRVGVREDLTSLDRMNAVTTNRRL